MFLSYHSKIYGKTISEYIVKPGGWSETSNVGCFFNLFTECVDETDFGRLIINLPNVIGDPLWYNYTVMNQI